MNLVKEYMIHKKIKNKLIYKEADLLSYLWSYKKGPNGPIFLYYLLDQVIANWNARINKTNAVWSGAPTTSGKSRY